MRGGEGRDACGGGLGRLRGGCSRERTGESARKVLGERCDAGVRGAPSRRTLVWREAVANRMPGCSRREGLTARRGGRARCSCSCRDPRRRGSRCETRAKCQRRCGRRRTRLESERTRVALDDTGRDSRRGSRCGCGRARTRDGPRGGSRLSSRVLRRCDEGGRGERFADDSRRCACDCALAFPVSHEHACARQVLGTVHCRERGRGCRGMRRPLAQDARTRVRVAA